MGIVLIVLGIISIGGGLLLVFGLDWVWAIDSRSEHIERDETGTPIRTQAWDRNHRWLGRIMLIVGVGLVILGTAR